MGHILEIGKRNSQSMNNVFDVNNTLNITEQIKHRTRHGCQTALNHASVCVQVNTELSQMRNNIEKKNN